MKFDLTDTDYDPLAWGSHLPSLLACLGATNGPVIELGVGHFSTPALHAFCGSAHRMLVSVEDSFEWFEPFKDKYESPIHDFEYVDYDKLFAQPRMSLHERWSVALIDNSPGGERRLKDFLTLLPVCDYVVMHDCHRENWDAVEPHLGGLKWRLDRDYEPPTLIASKVREMPL